MPRNKAKGPEEVIRRLRQASQRRKEIIERFGFVPTSILLIGRGEYDRMVRHYGRERGAHTNPVERDPSKVARRIGVSDPRILRRLGVSAMGSRKKSGETYSVMNPDLVAFFLEMYTKPGDLYYDPFAGHGVRGQVAKLMGRHYVGQDVCHKFCEYMRAVFREMDDGKTRLEIHEQTCERAVLGDNEADFTFTSPPYWDIEKYDDHPDQLGVGKTYEEFLEGLGRCAAENLRVLRPGAFCCIDIGDFFKDGRFYAFHCDTLNVYRNVGFEPWDVWILGPGVVSGAARIFAVPNLLRKRAPRVHEYVLVFRKPADGGEQR